MYLGENAIILLPYHSWPLATNYDKIRVRPAWFYVHMYISYEQNREVKNLSFTRSQKSLKESIGKKPVGATLSVCCAIKSGSFFMVHKRDGTSRDPPPIPSIIDNNGTGEEGSVT